MFGPPDRALYRRALAALDETSVMGYVDREAAAFVGGLRARGFFRRGGLPVATSDHRAMLPSRPEEAARFGASAPWRVALFFMADWRPRGRIDGRPAAQTDIAPTLEWLGSPATGPPVPRAWRWRSGGPSGCQAPTTSEFSVYYNCAAQF
jgi:hypothetical protein